MHMHTLYRWELWLEWVIKWNQINAVCFRGWTVGRRTLNSTSGIHFSICKKTFFLTNQFPVFHIFVSELRSLKPQTMIIDGWCKHAIIDWQHVQQFRSYWLLINLWNCFITSIVKVVWYLAAVRWKEFWILFLTTVVKLICFIDDFQVTFITVRI